MNNIQGTPNFKIEAAADGTFYVLMDGVRQHRWPSLEIAMRRVAHMQKWYAAGGE